MENVQIAKCTFTDMVDAWLSGELTGVPVVSYRGENIDYFGYQLSVHRFNLKIMASGMSVRGVKLKDLKQYYGLKGKSAKDCLDQFDKVVKWYEQVMTEIANL